MRRYALILATANYDDSAFRPLPSVHADAWYLPQVLEDPAIGGFEQVQVVKDAPAGEMRAATVDFLNRRGPDELALLYISGHGVWSREIGQLYFIATSTTNGRLPETGVAAEFVNEQLEACPAGCKVAILDCCFSGAFVQGFRTRGESGPPPEALTSRGVYVITASDSRETAYEGTTFNGSVAPSIFTGAFLEGLRTGRADLAGDGQISVDELYRYVHDQVKTMSLPTAQTPTKSAQRGEIILARSPTGRRERPRELVPLPAPEPVQRLRTPIPSRAAGLSDLAALDLAQWQRLLSYWLDCVIQEAASEELLDVERDQGSFACWPGAEQVLTGAVDQVQVPDGLADFFANAARNHKTLFYGYPAVIRMESAARQKKRRRTLAPLFMQQLEVHQDADRWTVSPVGPVLPHLALVLLRLPSGEAEAFVSSFEPNWAADEVSQFVREVRQRLEELGLREIEPLQPDKLSVDLRLQPPATGARNVAVVFEAPEKSAATAGLVTDLRAIIQQLASIAGTALGTLSSAAASGAASGDSAMVAPFSANEAQEAVIRSAMTRRLTVATGPPGTGKSQLVANLVATAVAADQSVLVASTNNQAVDEVVQRCDSIMPGLILRTGRETERQREADALDELLAWRGDGIDPATSWHTHRLRTDDVSQVRSSLHSQAVLEAELASLVQQREARAQAAHLQAGQLPPALAAHDSLHRWLERAR